MNRLKRYVNTDRELAEVMGVDPRTVSTWRHVHKLEIPHDLPDGRKDTAAWKEWHRKRKAAAVGSGGLRDEKLKREIELLDIEIGRMRETLLPLADLKDKMIAVSTLCIILVERFIENVSAKRRDADLEAELRECFDRARKELLEQAE